MKGFSRKKGDDERLPEERQFKRLLKGVVVAVVLFTIAFLGLTGLKACRSSQDITSNWFVAWGTWAGGLSTAAAFLIAAFSIMVASAHSRFDRHQEAKIREDDYMSQARLLSIYKVVSEGSFSTLPEYRIDNLSKDWFFDVTVPYVDSPNGAAGIEHRTASLVEKDLRFGERIPTGQQLTPYRGNTDDEWWFTLVRVHSTNARGIEFDVEYTDASGRRWRQNIDGEIKRIPTTKAVPIRPPDKFQPRPLIRKLSTAEKWRSIHTQEGNTEELPPLETDQDFLAVLEPSTVNNWKRIARTEDIRVEQGEEPNGDQEVAVTLSEIPPLWPLHFRGKLAESGLIFAGGQSRLIRAEKSRVQIDRFRCSPDVDTAGMADVIDAAIQYANDRFEEKELAAARRALESRIDRTGSVI